MCARDRIQARRLALVQDLQDEAYGTSCTGVFTSFIKVFGYLVGTPREQAGGVVDGEGMGKR